MSLRCCDMASSMAVFIKFEFLLGSLMAVYICLCQSVCLHGNVFIMSFSFGQKYIFLYFHPVPSSLLLRSSEKLTSDFKKILENLGEEKRLTYWSQVNRKIHFVHYICENNTFWKDFIVINALTVLK